MTKEASNGAKNCPLCEKALESAIFYGTEIDYCLECLGIWFEKGELAEAKDEKEAKLNWMDIDLWEKENEFHVSKEKKHCPECNLPLYEVGYGDSDIGVDICNICFGIWLDRGEFKKIIDYLRREGGEKIMNHYVKTLLEETGEIFVGPEPLKEEIADVFTVLGLLRYRFAGKHPFILEMISHLPSS